MKDRFDGDEGTRRLILALQDQALVEHQHEVAEAIVAHGQLVELATDSVLCRQGDFDSDVYFLITGEVEVRVNGRLVAKRGAGQSIGEMVLPSPAAHRSASIIAAKPTLALRVSEPHMQQIAESHPQLWRAIAKVTAQRLREREQFHRLPNPVPNLFLGSSVEGMPIAHAIATGLKYARIIPRIWTSPGLFDPGGVNIDVLLREVDTADFAAFVFGPDDRIALRGSDYSVPRDNVIFELGLFMGTLDRRRAVFIQESGADIKIPSDLLGVVPITFVRKAGQNEACMIAPVCIELIRIVKELGPR